MGRRPAEPRSPGGDRAPDDSGAGPTGAFLAVCGHANIDVQIQVKELPGPGQSVQVLDRRTVRGGTAANIARHAAGLGVPVRLWSRVGDDFPADWRKDLESDGVDLLHLDVARGGRTPTCFILTDLVERQSFCMDQGAMAGMVDHPPEPSLLDGMPRGGWLHLATGDPVAYAPLAKTARERGLYVALDPGQELRFMYDARSFEGLLEMSDVLFLNQDELKIACGYLGYADPVQFLDHVATVVVTRGAKGASLYRSGKKAHHLPAFPVRVVDPTGAGDALRAGWYAALWEGRTSEEALRRGQAAAAVKLGHAGPQDPVVRPVELEQVLSGAPSVQGA